MIISDLQQLLSDLAKLLRNSKAGSVPTDLESFSAMLAPFREYKLPAFGEFLIRAKDGAPASPPPKPRAKTKANPQAVAEAGEQVLALFARATDPSVTGEQIEAALQNLECLDPPLAVLKDLARRMGYTQNFGKKGDAFKAIRQKMLGHKGAWDRVNA